MVATCHSDQKFVHKKVDNYVVLKFQMRMRPGFKPESSELCFALHLETSSEKYS